MTATVTPLWPFFWHFLFLGELYFFLCCSFIAVHGARKKTVFWPLSFIFLFYFPFFFFLFRVWCRAKFCLFAGSFGNAPFPHMSILEMEGSPRVSPKAFAQHCKTTIPPEICGILNVKLIYEVSIGKPRFEFQTHPHSCHLRVVETIGASVPPGFSCIVQIAEANFVNW